MTENERLWRRVSWPWWRGDGGWRDSKDKTSARGEAFILQWWREAVLTNSRASTAIWESDDPSIQSKSHPWG